MKKIILVVCILSIIAGCKKKSDDQAAKSPGKFYISFKIADSTFNYRSNDTTFTYVCYGITGHHSDGRTSFHPTTFITPLPLELEVYKIRFEFNYYAPCVNCIPDYTKYGNEAFFTGSRNICKTDQLYTKHCTDNKGCTISWTDASGTELHSLYGNQPAGAFFYIDSVYNYQYRGADMNVLDYDKIIVGRFACRVFDPANTSYTKDLTEGKFRMPVWRNY